MPKKDYYYIYQSSVSGRFVTKEFAETNPDTTFRRKIRKTNVKQESKKGEDNG